ncbi:MAG: DUF4157 domain-containing protein, partial [Myxococcales bacterium]|nr:DUF4157 domain-containing protein [Myxococcales bacterium]
SDPPNPVSVIQTALGQIETATVMASRSRLAVLSASEFAAVAQGKTSLSELPSVDSSGDTTEDLARWARENESLSTRTEALAGRGRDADYLIVTSKPTPTGDILQAFPISPGGRPASEPLMAVSVPASPEPTSVVRTIAERTGGPERERTSISLSAEPTEAPERPFAAQLESAMAINQARISVYQQVLSSRDDLRGAARAAAERRLERLEGENQTLAGLDDPSGLQRQIGAWLSDLDRDISTLSGRMGRPGDHGYSEGLDALARLGAIRARLAALMGRAPSAPRTMSGSEPRVFLHSQPAATSIFDQLSATPGTVARRAESVVPAGEPLSHRVSMRAAERAASSPRQRQEVRQLAAAGAQLARAMANQTSASKAGLGLSSSLTPLARVEMPSELRPKTDSPILRQVFLPAMERVSGPGRAMARTAAQQMSSSGLTRTPPSEALYGMILGEEGVSLAERAPNVARGVLDQMGGLAERLVRSGVAPTASAMWRAGSALRDRILGVAANPTGDGAPDSLQQAGNAVESAVSAAASRGAEATSQGLAATVDRAAADLAQEGAPLAAAIKEKIEPFVEVSSHTRMFSGPTASRALDEMGALGASVGQDIFVHQRVLAKGGAEAAAIVGHEAVHAQRSRLGAASLQSEEQAAYEVESQIRDSVNVGELAKEDSGGTAEAEDTSQGGGEQKFDKEGLIEKLADLVGDLIGEELEMRRARGNI